ncbi:MAG: D-sedoheptulose-7-phosphate isomerase [Acetobacteraceae bacterium]
MDEATRFREIMERSAALKRRLANDLRSAVLAVVDAAEKSLRAGGKLLFCGNGGSAAGAAHLATECLIRLRASHERRSYPALALTLDPVALTAVGNDYGFARAFERPLRGLGHAGDLLFALSTSGRSENILAALAAAGEMGVVTVGLLGGDGGPAAALCRHVLLVPDRETARVQECHITLGHALLELLEDRLVARPLS